MSRKPSKAVYVSKELSELLLSLGSQSRLRKWVDDMKMALADNMLVGEKIMKDRIPEHYVRLYGVNNLFRYSHPEGYRSCYTLHGFDGIGVCPVILDIVSHEEYERIFGYGKR